MQQDQNLIPNFQVLWACSSTSLYVQAAAAAYFELKINQHQRPSANIFKFCSWWSGLNCPGFNIVFSISMDFNLIFKCYCSTKKKKVLLLFYKGTKLFLRNYRRLVKKAQTCRTPSSKTTCLKYLTNTCARNTPMSLSHRHGSKRCKK